MLTNGSGIFKTQLTYAGLKHLRHRPGISLRLKGRVYIVVRFAALLDYCKKRIRLLKMFVTWRFLIIDVCVVSLGLDGMTR